MIVVDKVYKEGSPHDDWARGLGIDPTDLDNPGGGGGSDIDRTLQNQQEEQKKLAEQEAAAKAAEEAQAAAQARAKELEEKEQRSKEEEEELAKLKQDSEENNEGEEEEEDEPLTLQETEERIKALKEKGDQITDDEKEELGQLEYSLLPTVVKLRDSYGYEQLKDREYEDSDQGLLQLSKDVATLEVENALQELHSADPLLAALYEHSVVKGLSGETFVFAHTAPDFSKIDIKDEAGQEALANLYFDKLNIGAEEKKTLIDSYKNQGILDKKSKEFKEKLDEAHKAEVKAREDKEIADKEAAAENSKKVVQQIDGILKSGKVRGIPLPPEDIKSLREGIYSDKLQEAWSKITLEDRLLLDYIVLKEFKVKGLDVQQAVNSIKLGGLGAQIATRKAGLPNTTTTGKKKTSPSQQDQSIPLHEQDVDVNTLLKTASN